MSDDNGDRAPAFDGGNIDGRVANFDKGMRHPCGGQQTQRRDGSNKQAAAVVVAAGRGGKEAPTGSNYV
jgi:hypothetical protein